ncbi:hypothetical protein HDU86_000597, partial [Geranomyces michiganensis]
MTAAPTASPVAPVVPHKQPRENADGNPSASKKPTSNAVTLSKKLSEQNRLQNELEAARNAAALQTSTAAIPVVEMVDQEEEEWQSLMEKLTPQCEEDEPADDGERLHDIPDILTEWRGYEVMKSGLSADGNGYQLWVPVGCGVDCPDRFYNSDAPDALKKKMLANIADNAAETNSN